MNASIISQMREAVQSGNVVQAHLLIEKNPELLRSCVKNRDWLQFAAECGQSTMTAFLVQTGMDPNWKNVHGETALWVAMNLAESIPSTRALLEGGADPDSALNSTSLLHLSMMLKEAPRFVDVLLQHRAQPNVLDARGFAPLAYAVRKNHRGMVLALLTHGADPLLQSGDATNAAQEARTPGHEGVLADIEAWMAANHAQRAIRAVEASSNLHGLKPLPTELR